MGRGRLKLWKLWISELDLLAQSIVQDTLWKLLLGMTPASKGGLTRRLPTPRGPFWTRKTHACSKMEL